MRFTRIILSIVFVLFASSAFAEKSEKIKKEKPGKILVCHVGSEEGPDGDALKVDLISVSPKSKHIGNAEHSFLDAEGFLWEDYSPEDGIGDDPLDFEEGDVPGIDRGCELDTVSDCPCNASNPAGAVLPVWRADFPAVFGQLSSTPTYTGYYVSDAFDNSLSTWVRPNGDQLCDIDHFATGDGIQVIITTKERQACEREIQMLIDLIP